ncbi:MAG: helix-turn-helix domain-containing protein [Sphingomonas sp.]
MTDIQLDYAVPSTGMASYVTLFYWFRADVPLFEDVERADHAQIRFRLTPGGAEYTFADGTVQTASDVHIVGPTTGAVHVRAIGPVHVFGAGITPVGWAALVGNDASAMVNRVVNLPDLFGPAILDVISELGTAPDLDALVARGEMILGKLFRGGRDPALDFVQKVDAWLCDETSPGVRVLAMATGLSPRQVERKCRSLYGAPPKELARKYRALRAAVSLVADGASIDEVVARGFYDQSHLIREVKQFTGFTPGQIQAEPSILAQLTIAQRYALAGKVHPLISDT